MLTEPVVGVAYVYQPTNMRRDYGEPLRYIILDVQAVDADEWRLDLVSVLTERIHRRHRYAVGGGSVTFEPLAEGEEVLFCRAMLAPQTLEEA